MNEVVKYKNRLNELIFKTVDGHAWTGQEIKTFFSILCLARDKGEELFSIDLAYLKNICGYKHYGFGQFIRHLVQMDESKLKYLCFVKYDRTGYDRITVFSRFRVDIENNALMVRVDKEALKYLNNVKQNFTRFDLSEVVGLKNKYSILLYRELKQFRTRGWWKPEYSIFKELLGVETFSNKKIREKVINPSVEELQTCFKELKVERIYKNTENGKEIDMLYFTFVPEEVPNKEETLCEWVKDSKDDPFMEMEGILPWDGEETALNGSLRGNVDDMDRYFMDQLGVGSRDDLPY